MSLAESKHEVRVYGLNEEITAQDLLTYFSHGVKVLNVIVHRPPSHHSMKERSNWAQLWTTSSEEVEKCMGLEAEFEKQGMTLMRAPSALTLFSPIPKPASLPLIFPPSPPYHNLSISSALAPSPGLLAGAVPRNLYVLNIPIELTQNQFKTLFVPYGMVEHSTLLSQLDGFGRRRGFVLMSTHREASEVLAALNGRVIDGFKVDISWALVQREARHFNNQYVSLQNRVIHPPVIPTKREPPPECSVLVEHLNPQLFPTGDIIRQIFSHFGPVSRVTVIPGSEAQAIIAFDHPISAAALINSNGMSLGGRTIYTRSLMANSSDFGAVGNKTRKTAFSTLTSSQTLFDEPQESSNLNPAVQAFVPGEGTSTDLRSSDSARGGFSRFFCKKGAFFLSDNVRDHST